MNNAKRRRALAATAAVVGLLLLGPSTAPAAPPEVVKVSVSTVKETSGVLHAVIKPNGKVTPYQFQYGLVDCAIGPCTSTSQVNIPAGVSDVPVEAKVEGLTPGTIYHFRVVATNSEGNDESPDRTFVTQAAPPPFGACPNDQVRSDPPAKSFIDYLSANLPDCRAYEQASPIVKNGLDARGMVASSRASIEGNAVSFVTTSGIPEGEGLQDIPSWLATRNADGWSTEGMLPPASAGQQAFVAGWSPDFSHVFDYARRLGPPKEAAFLSLGSADRSLEEIVPYGEATDDAPAFVGSSPDGSIVALESSADLAPGAVAGESNVYVWERATGELRLASRLPDPECGTAPCSPPNGSFAGSYDWIGSSAPAVIGDKVLKFGGARPFNYFTQDLRAISADGRDVYFTAATTGELYLRLNATEEQSPISAGECTDPAKACTLHLSASQRTTPDPAGPRPAAFMAASDDGSTAYFTSPEKLTDDAKTGPEQPAPSIARADIADGDPLQLNFIPERALGLAVGGTFLYWANPVDDTIGRAKLNGAGAATEVDPDFITVPDIEVEPGVLEEANPQDVAVDSEHVYWTSATDGKVGTGTIGRAKASDGGEVDEEFITGASEPIGIDVNTTHVYWGNLGPGPEGAVGRATLDGSTTPEQEFISAGAGGDVAVNATHIYYSRFEGFEESGFVRRANIDGSSPQNMAGCSPSLVEAKAVPSIRLDASFIYLANPGGDRIGRANLDCSSLNPNFIAPAGHPLGLANDAGHLYWSANQEPVPNPGNDLYRFDADSGELTDITGDAPGANGAEVKGVLGTSADGSTVYFAANGDLDGGGAATAGDCKGSADAIRNISFTGECSVYRAEGDAAPTFVTGLDADGNASESDATNWLPYGTGGNSGLQRTARVSADGQTLLLRSQRRLTAYENEGVPHFYRFEVGEPDPTCLTCNPSGAAPTDAPQFNSIGLSFLFPGTTPALVWTRNLSADGNRFFFETTEGLLPVDTNGDIECPSVGTDRFAFPTCQDVYMWEAEGAGSCESATQGGGCLYLLSTGKSQNAAFFGDASLSGDDAFVVTSAKLVGQDQDQLYDVYDARVGGGLLSQNELAPPACTSIDGCLGPVASPPATESPGTGNVTGPGNVKAKKTKARCPQGKRLVRAKGKARCVRKGKGKKRRNRTAGKTRRVSR